MGMKTITVEAPEESIALLDEIAANLGEDRGHVLSEALADYLADYAALKAEMEEADRQFEAGESISHEEMLARFEAMKTLNREKQAT